MKKSLAVIALVMTAVLSLCLVSCGNSSNSSSNSASSSDLVGTWNASWEYNGNSYDGTITLKKDNTYESAVFKGGEQIESEDGTFTFEDNTLRLIKVASKKDGNPLMYTEYQLIEGRLVNDEIKYSKTS